MASHKDVLTDAEFGTYRPHPLMVDYIERCQARFGVDRSDFRIVEWGCGRGRMVLWLREQGYDAVGVDIDPSAIARGVDLFRLRGHDAESYLRPLDSAGKSPFPDSSFHCVISWQTLEHVEDLGAAVAEWRRLTMDGGGGFHIYPCHHRSMSPSDRRRTSLHAVRALAAEKPHAQMAHRLLRPTRDRSGLVA